MDIEICRKCPHFYQYRDGFNENPICKIVFYSSPSFNTGPKAVLNKESFKIPTECPYILEHALQ